MVPEKKYESILQKLKVLEEENVVLKQKLSVSGEFEQPTKYRDYHTYFNKSLDGIFVMESIYGVPSSFVEINDALVKLLGYSREEILDFDPLDLLAEGEKKRLLSIAENILEQQEIYFLTAFRDNKKRRVPVEISIKTLDSSVNPQLIGIARSTEDKDDASKLKNSTEMVLRKIVSATNEMVMHITATPQFKFNYISPASKKILGYTNRELYNNPMEFLNNLHPEDYKTLMNLLDKNKGTGLPHLFRFLRKDEKLIWLEMYVTNEDKETTLKHGFYAIIHDVTYRQQMERLINKKLRVEHLIAEISRSFINYDNLKATIHKSIEDTGLTMNIDCIDLCIGLGNDPKNQHSWINPSCKPTSKNKILILEGKPFIDGKLSEGEMVYLVANSDIPEEHEDERQLLSEQGIKSMLAAPMQFYGRTMGYLAFYQLKKEKEWDRVEINLINTLSSTYNSILKKEIVMEQKDKIFELSNKLEIHKHNPYPNKEPKFILSFNFKGEITGCLGTHPMFNKKLQSKCEERHINNVFPKNISLMLKDEFSKLCKDKQPRFFNATLTPVTDRQYFGMFYYRKSKCLLCLYN